MNEVIINRYDSLNRAIDSELEKYQSQTQLRRATSFLYRCLAIGLLILLVALSWLIYVAASRTDLGVHDSRRPAPEEIDQGPNSSVIRSTPEENLQIRQDLQILELRDQQKMTNTSSSIAPPEKQYTAFTFELTETGESVVTGRVFATGKWDRPVEQYCYLTRAIAEIATEREVTDLAVIGNSGEMVLLTSDQVLVRFARDYCRFE